MDLGSVVSAGPATSGCRSLEKNQIKKSHKQQATSGAGGPANHQAQPQVVFYVYIPPSPAAVQV